MRLLNFGVHEYGTAGTKVNGVFRKKSCLGEILNGIVKGLCKGFDERSATRRACFVQKHAVYGLVLDLNAFHVLSADIQDTVDTGLKESGGIVVGNGLNFAVVQHKGGLHELFAVSGGAGSYNP